jgi:glucose-6-phosphate 1-dehydrogenase
LVIGHWSLSNRLLDQWKMENGKWKMENDSVNEQWKMNNGKWKMSVTVEAKPFSISEPPPKEIACPCVVVIFGALGDLTKRKLIPALFHLVKERRLPESFKVLGVGQDRMNDDEFRKEILAGASSSKEMGRFDAEWWETFATHLSYLAGDLTDAETYSHLAARLERGIVEEGASSNRLWYAATPPSILPVIVHGLGETQLASERKGWSRIVVEKPFGYDLHSARALNALIARVFDEHQVYRIDHYLGKETVRNILVFRFGNSLFEPVWNRNYIDYVEITAAETNGIDGRANYYEETGALLDMVANHLLQLVTLTAMAPPVAFDADSVRNEKLRVLRSIHPMTPAEVAECTVRGQYGAGEIDGKGVQAYRDERGVTENSRIETYAAVEFRVENWRWSDVPFFLRTGKRLAHQVTEIVIHFKRTPQALFARAPEQLIEPNTIVLRIHPNEGIIVTFGAKRPGSEMRTTGVHMDFCYQRAFDVRLPTAYETLLLDVMGGDATLFIRRDEVEAQWELIDPILKAWANQSPPEFPDYRAGSDGPEAAAKLLERGGHRWRHLLDSHGCEEKVKGNHSASATA